MKVWEVTNGYMGFSYVRVYVVADTEERAKELASQRFKKEGERYNERYWTNLEALCLCDDCSQEFVSEVMD